MNEHQTEEELIHGLVSFEKRIVDLFEDARIPYPIHLSGGNERELIAIYREIQPGDYIFSTHRSHYHYLLAGGPPAELERMILAGDSMHVFDRTINFLTSAIVAGGPAIAVGVALGLKRQGSTARVWCFAGDGAEDEGHFYEAVRYVDGHDLPLVFVIEDNDRSVETPKGERHGASTLQWPACVRRYAYTPTFPHVGTGTGNMIEFGGKKIERACF
jgi:pyruvate dehydrogenase E1 component alpha subunit